MPAPVISVLNMKGGVGKTTVSAHVMRSLYHRHRKKVLLIDLDAQFNLTQILMTEQKYDRAVDTGKTVISCFEPSPSRDFFQVRHTDLPPPHAPSVSKRLRKIAQGQLDLLPGSFELVKYSMIDDAAQLRHAANFFKRFISQAKTEYDLIVLDCNPSSSFVTKCALESSSHVLSPVKLDRFSILGVRHIGRLFDLLQLNLVHMILINAVNRGDKACIVEERLRADKKYGPLVLNGRLAQSKYLAADPTYAGFATERRGPYSRTMRVEIGKISDEIAKKVWGR